MMSNDDLPAEGFEEIPVGLPPQLSALCGHNGISSCFAIYYLGSKAAWHDGYVSATFSYYAAFEPLINHPAVAPYLAGRDLGSDDTLATHALLCDRRDGRMWVGPWKDAVASARAHNPQPIAPEPPVFPTGSTSLEELRELGMFELLLGPSAASRELGAEMVAWLDARLTPQMLEKAVQIAKRDPLVLDALILLL